MALTAQEEAEYQKLGEMLGQSAPPAANGPRPGFMRRLGSSTLNSVWQTPVDIGIGLVGRLAKAVSPPEFAASADSFMQGNRESVAAHGIQLPAAQTGWDTAADVGGAVIGSLPTYVGGARLLGGAARGLGAGQKASRILGGAATGAISGASHSNMEMGLQAAEFGAMEGAMALLPPATHPFLRALAGSATGVGVGATGQKLRGRDVTSKESLIQLGVMGALPFAMEGRGLMRGRSPTKGPSTPTEPTKQEMPADWEFLGEGEGTFRFRTPQGDVEFAEMPFAQVAPSTASSEFIEVPAAPPAEPMVLPEQRPLMRRAISDKESAGAAREEVGSIINEVEGFAPPDQMPSVSMNEPFTQGRLRKLRGREEGAIDPALQSFIARGALTAGTYMASDDENKIANTAAVGGALFGLPLLKRSVATRQAMREAAGEKLAGQAQTTGRAVLGSIQRFGEKYLKLDRDAGIDVAQQQGIGVAETLAADMASALKTSARGLKNLTPAQRTMVDIYLGSDRSPGAEALLKSSGLPAEVEGGILEANRIKTELQKVWGEAQSDPKKRALIQSTLGQWQTMAYKSYIKPSEWKWTPAQFDAVVAENMASPHYAGKSRDFVEKDVRDWLSEVANFEGRFDRVANEGASRMSKSPFMQRKTLTPAVKDILGEIKDPFEREVLSVTKLASGAATAKTVTELARMTDSKGLRFGMPVSQWEAELNAARAAGDKVKESDLLQYKTAPDMEGIGVLSKSPAGEQMMVQRGVLDALQAGPGHATQLPGWLDALAKITAKVSRVPKGAMTLYNPGTHMRNAGQMILQSISAGVGPVAFVRNLARLSDGSIYRGSGKTLKELMREDNIGTAHLGAGEFRRVSENLEKLLSPGIMGRIRGAHEVVKSIYGISDKLVRSAAYVKFLDEAAEKGMGVAQARRYAIEQTNRYTQNYSGVSQAVEVARNIPGLNPFLSYTAEMLRVMKNLAGDVVSTTATGRRKTESAVALATLLGTGGALKFMLESMFSDEKGKAALAELTPLLPDFARGRINASVGTSESGEAKVFNTTPWLPAGDIVATAQNILRGDFDAFMAANPVAGLRSPLISTVVEEGSGRDPFTGRENYGVWDKRVRPLLKNMLPPLTPGNYQAEKLRRAFTTNEDGGMGVTDPQTGRRDTPADALLSTAGVNVSTYSKPRLLRQREGEIARELSDARSKARAILRTDVNEGEKQQAREELRRKEEQLQERRRLLR